MEEDINNTIFSIEENINKFKNIFNENEIKYIDLFCGLGAFHQAFNFLTTDKLKYKCVFACDINDSVRRIYKENYNIKTEGDINRIDINTKIDLRRENPNSDLSFTNYIKNKELQLNYII